MPVRDNSRRRVRIKKRRIPWSQRRTPLQVLEDWLNGFWTWLSCMYDPNDPRSSIYSEIFPAAFWGEAGEYGVRFSTMFGIVLIVSGIACLIFLSGAKFGIKFKTVSSILLIIIGLRQLRDLSGPIWWADRYAVEQVKRYEAGKRVEDYEPYSETMQRLHPDRNFARLLSLDEIRRLAELYHQSCTGTISMRSWRELSEYTPEQINFFYKVTGVGDQDYHFPVAALKQPEAT